MSQVLLALSGYVLLALAARTMPAAGFAAVSAFYLLLNTVGRGIFASVELETSRALAAADAAGEDGRPVLATAARRAAVLLVAAVALSLAATPLLPGIEIACALALGSATMAASYCVRGPLAARRRFPAYSATFLLEAGFTLLGALGLAVTHVDAVAAWTAVLVLSPGIAAVLVAVRASRAGVWRRLPGLWSAGSSAASQASVHRISLAALIWTSLFYLSSQGVWNLAPVSVTSSLAAVPSEAAGFVAVAVILRAPVFVFPAIQAVLLPSVSAAAQHDDREGSRRALRPLLVLLGAVAVPWLLAAVFVVPWLARLAFAVRDVPLWPATAALAASTVVGAAAFVLQTRVLAFRRHRDVGLAWRPASAPSVSCPSSRAMPSSGPRWPSSRPRWSSSVACSSPTAGSGGQPRGPADPGSPSAVGATPGEDGLLPVAGDGHLEGAQPVARAGGLREVGEPPHEQLGRREREAHLGQILGDHFQPGRLQHRVDRRRRAVLPYVRGVEDPARLRIPAEVPRPSSLTGVST